MRQLGTGLRSTLLPIRRPDRGRSTGSDISASPVEMGVLMLRCSRSGERREHQRRDQPRDGGRLDHTTGGIVGRPLHEVVQRACHPLGRDVRTELAGQLPALDEADDSGCGLVVELSDTHRVEDVPRGFEETPSLGRESARRGRSSSAFMRGPRPQEKTHILYRFV